MTREEIFQKLSQAQRTAIPYEILRPGPCPDQGELVCKKMIITRPIANDSGWWASLHVRAEIERLGIRLALGCWEGDDDDRDYVENCIMIRGFRAGCHPPRPRGAGVVQAQFQWLRHGGALCSVPYLVDGSPAASLNNQWVIVESAPGSA